VADGRQAALQHGGPRPQRARRPGRSRPDRDRLPQQERSGDRRRRTQPSGQNPRRRLAQLPDYSAASLHAFLKTNLAPGAAAKTDDGWSGYPGAPGVNHDPHVVGNMAAHIVLPWAHRIFSNLKVWALGVYHGLRRKHLPSYLDEFVFRFNRRRTRHAAFRSLLGIATAHAPLSYKMLILPEAKA
jgi:hypothetical protein